MEPVPGTQRRLTLALQETQRMRAQINQRPARDERMLPPTPNEITTRLLANQEALIEAVAQLFATVLPESPLANEPDEGEAS